MFVKLLVVGLLACVHSINTANVPFITKCKADDAKCMKTSAQAAIKPFTAGIPELGVESMQPFFMKSIDASSDTLKLVLTDITGTGLDQCIVKKTAFDSAKLLLELKVLCTVEFKGLYEMDGQLLVLPIQGKGQAHVVLRKLQVSVDVNMAEKSGKDGLPHWSIKSYKHNYELKDKATIELENLFNGNEVLGRAAKELFENNSNEIVNTLGPKIVGAVIKKVAKNVDHFFEHVPRDDLVIY